MDFRLRYKIWLENDEGKPVIGMGKVKILLAIRRLGSISAAARELDQPYRNVWAKIREAEKQCGYKLVETGPSGSKLTKNGENLLSKYICLFRSCSRSAKSKFHQLFASDCDAKINNQVDSNLQTEEENLQ
ncbi:MAG: LysR family transcriptional regulator [Desulfomonilaceae bacterium]|jgi:molybdate transport system regulatory protein